MQIGHEQSMGGGFPVCHVSEEIFHRPVLWGKGYLLFFVIQVCNEYSEAFEVALERVDQVFLSRQICGHIFSSSPEIWLSTILLQISRFPGHSSCIPEIANTMVQMCENNVKYKTVVFGEEDKMKLIWLADQLAICRLLPGEAFPAWALQGHSFLSITST